MKVLMVLFIVNGPNVYSMAQSPVEIDKDRCLEAALEFNIGAIEKSSPLRVLCLPVPAEQT